MEGTYQAETTTTTGLLTGLNLAINEAKLVRSLIKSKDEKYELEIEDPLSDKLVQLNREIQYLELKIIQVRSSRS